MEKWNYLFIIIGASLWGTIGIFVQGLYSLGLTPLQVVTVRVTCAAIILILYLLITNPSFLRIHKQDYKYFVGTGIFSIVFFNWCFFTAIQETSLSVAAILLYTGPAFVTILSRILFKEWLTTRKLFALLLTLVGCIFVIGLFPLENSKVSLFGVIVGIGSGLTYALYSIFCRYALKKYNSQTVTAYTFIFAAIALIPLSGLWNVENIFHTTSFWSNGISLGFFPTVLAYLLYTKGLNKVETSKASITATIEPVVAACIGIFMFGDLLTMWQLIGISSVLLGVIVVSDSTKGQKHKKTFQRGQTTA
ncbi:EamA family transporter [Anaerobacillus alkalilacustris]|uniref:EamA family transporter n=1 Tax=Anaerobacillus alkalilacustris TaxID=393763 RepID=A0A1S2LDX1_9BACI|nr:EamA family transporter [Anaerobacillus alkalilacustris]OIJ10514.1 EamA family transporter [Anaerobacillus alkalilacustris]